MGKPLALSDRARTLSVISTSLLRAAVRTPTFRAGVAGRDIGPLWWVAEDAKRLETGEEWNFPLEKHPEDKEGTQMYGGVIAPPATFGIERRLAHP